MKKKKKKKPFGKSVRTLFEVPNLEYKGRLSVLYSSQETFRLSSCPRDQRARESTPLPPPASSQAWLKTLRHRAAELQRRPSASFVLDLRVEHLRRHWLSSPSSSLSHLGNLRQKSLAVPSAQELEEDMHQKIAREMNLSETAFIRKLHPTDNFAQSSCFGLRWFTPASEVPLCGHATLASAAVLFYKIKNVNSTLTFVTLSGELRARQAEDGIVLDLPLYPVYSQTAIGNTLVQDICYSPDTRKLLLRLSDTYDRSFLENLKVNTENLLQVENTGKVKGLILTLKGEPGGQSQSFDFYSRYFAPWVGVAEDPVTGSAHAVLSSYWSQQLGKKEMHAFQCSQRGGELGISLRPDGRVDIRGGAAVVLEGTLTA
uniref:Phenazine biosynthesis like protein domain containing n=1 Tax=Papio anubis TaxID=9555 RepID=A0A8I5NVF6_PAPAN